MAYAFGPRWGNPFRHFAVFVFNVFTQAFQVLLIFEVGDTSIAASSFLEMFYQKGEFYFKHNFEWNQRVCQAVDAQSSRVFMAKV